MKVLGQIITLCVTFDNCHTIFQSSCHFISSTETFKGFNFFTFSAKLIIYIFYYCHLSESMNAKFYLMVFICLSLMSNGVEHLFMYLLAICTTQGHENLSLCSFQEFHSFSFYIQVYDSFELIFVCTVKRSNFILLYVAIQLSKIILSPLNVLHSS